MSDLVACVGQCGRRRQLQKGWICEDCDMVLLVSGATKTVKRLKGHKHLGVLITPQTGNKPPTDMVWAADNSCFHLNKRGWDEVKFMRMLDRISKLKNSPKFVTCPDVVCDAISTNKLWREWSGVIRAYGLEPAYVAQNGVEAVGVPNDFKVLFIGGDNTFKMSKYVRYLIKKHSEKWIHVGRVNSQSRAQQFIDLGCVDSIDGTGFSMFPDQKIPKFLRFLETEQLHLGFDY